MNEAQPNDDCHDEETLPRPSSPGRRALRWAEHLLVITAVSVILFVLTPLSAWVHESLDCQNPLAPARYIICLGGRASRVIEAARLLKEGHAEHLIVSSHGRDAARMRDLAIEWGAPADRVLVDNRSFKTLDHPEAIRQAVGLDPANDVCIIVTSYTHMARSRACFDRAGYRHILMREPRWERQFRPTRGLNWKERFLVLPKLVYEGAAWLEYWVRGAV